MESNRTFPGFKSRCTIGIWRECRYAMPAATPEAIPMRELHGSPLAAAVTIARASALTPAVRAAAALRALCSDCEPSSMTRLRGGETPKNPSTLGCRSSLRMRTSEAN